MNRNIINVIVVSVAMFVAACTETTMTGSAGAPVSTAVSGKNAAEVALEKEVASLRQQTQDIVVRNTVQGAMVGAAAGCALALLMGGDGDDCARGAVVGGVAGGVGGNAVGQQAAAKNAELVNADKVLANLKGINGRLGAVSDRLSSVLAAQKTEIASLKRQLEGQQISQSAYDSRIRAINSNRSAVIKGLQAAEGDVSKSRVELVSIGKEGGTSYPALQTAAQSTEKRLRSLRGAVSMISTN